MQGALAQQHRQPELQAALHPKQFKAFSSPATEILYGGAAGGGKSHLQRVVAISLAHQVPGAQIYIFRRSYPELYDTHMSGEGGFPVMLADWVNRGWAKINNSKNDIHIGRSTIRLRHCQHPKDVYRYQGPEIHCLMVDEITHWEERMYAFLRSRLRLGSLEIPEGIWQDKLPMALNTSNPGGVGHNWVKRQFVDSAAPFEVHTAPTDEGGMLRQFIPARLEDNPTLDRKDYAAKLRGLGDEMLVKAMLAGDWNIVAEGMFEDLWDEEVHTVEPFKIPSSWEITRCFDWGSSKPFWVGWFAESDGTEVKMPDLTKRSWPRGTLFLIAEWYGWTGRENQGLRMTAPEIAEGIVKREGVWGLNDVRPGPADASIYKEENNNCIARDMESKGVKFVPADNSPGTRVPGWEKMRIMLKAALQQPMEDPGLFIFNSERDGLLRTLPTAPRSKRKYEDLDTDYEDHALDGTRYRVMGGSYKVETIRRPI